MSNNRDAFAKRPRRRPSASGEIAWQQTYPDELLEQLPDRREGPEDVTGDAAYEPLAIDVLPGAGRGCHRDRHPRPRGVPAFRPARHARRHGRQEMNTPGSITVTPVFIADLLVEGGRMPVCVHVIDHPDARVLVDTGIRELHPAVADMDPRLRPLEDQDFDLAGIDIVNTHLHFDHCGGNHLFAGRPIYLQRRELDDARSEDEYTIREWVEAPGVRYVPVDGELELLPGLRLFPAPGHPRALRWWSSPPAGNRSSSAVTSQCGSANSTNRTPTVSFWSVRSTPS